jgi:hypothetical protein
MRSETPFFSSLLEVANCMMMTVGGFIGSTE